MIRKRIPQTAVVVFVLLVALIGVLSVAQCGGSDSHQPISGETYNKGR